MSNSDATYVNEPKKGTKVTRENRRALDTPPRSGPKKLTQALADSVIEHINRGCYIETACGAVGIGKSTLYDWLRWGNEGREPYATFAARMMQARDEAEAADVAYIKSAPDWRARAWRLEKMHGRKYAGVTVTESRIDVEVASPEQLAAKVRAIYGIAPPEQLTALPAPQDVTFLEADTGTEEETGGGRNGSGEPGQ